MTKITSAKGTVWERYLHPGEVELIHKADQVSFSFANKDDADDFISSFDAKQDHDSGLPIDA